MENKSKRVIGFTELKEKYLHHRYPLLMIDRVTDYRENEYIEAIKCVTGNSPELIGHYPTERSIMPGTHVIQAFSQLAIIFFKISNGPLKADELTLVSSMKAKFLKPIFPGDTIHILLKPKRMTAEIGMFICDAKVEDQIVVRGSLTLVKTSVSKFVGAPW